MSLPNIFGPTAKDPNDPAEKVLRLSREDVEALSDEEVMALGRGLLDSTNPIARALAQITENVIELTREAGSAYTADFLRGLLERVEAHTPGHSCEHCGYDTPEDAA